LRQLLVTSMAVLVLGSALWGCGGDEKESSGPTPNVTPGAGSSGEPVGDPLTGDATRTVAEVGDETITLGDVNLLVKAWQAGRNAGVDPLASVAQLQKQAIDNLIEQKLILQTATQRGLTPSEAELTAAMDRVKGQFPNEAALTTLLQQEGMTLEQFTKGFRADMTIRNFVEKAYLDTMQVSDADAETFYKANPERFNAPPQVSARHILIRSNKDGGVGVDEVAKNKADTILKRARAGEDFIELAKTTSEDETTRDNGGDLGYFASGVMVPEFDQMVFSLNIGDVSEVIQTQFGYHIIRVDDKKPAGMMELAQVAPQIKELLRNEKAGNKVTELVEKLKTEVAIKREI